MNTIISFAIPEVQLIQITIVIPITIHILPSTVTDDADYSLVQREVHSNFLNWET